MKAFTLLMGLIGYCLLFAACESDEEKAPDYQEQEQKLIDRLVPQFLGIWQLDKVYISKVSNQRQPEAGITSDTILQDVGTLLIDDCQNIAGPRYPECHGMLTYQELSIPVRFGLLGASERVVEGTGPYAFFLFRFDFAALPDDYDWDQSEIAFLRNINLINENFAIDRISADTMVWSGLNASSRGLDSVLFKRLD